MIRRFLIMLGIVATVAVAKAQISAQAQDDSFVADAPTMSVRFEPDSIAIGDHTTLMIEVDKDVMQLVAFPDFEMNGKDTPMEMVGEPTVDTISVTGRRVKLRRNYRLTTFDEGLYNLGRVAILYSGRNGADTLLSDDSLRLQVTTFMIDSTSHSVYDIKPIKTLPFKFREISGYTMWSILALIVLAVSIYAFLRLMAYIGRPVMGMFIPAPPVAPHVAAIAALTALREERLWQDGEYKGYYSRLSDILRTYISGRYGVAAMEMTSDEIIAAARELELPTQCEMELRDLLRDADLVKFAKAEFSASTNERYFESACLFVEQTKEVEEVAEGEDEESQSDDKK